MKKTININIAGIIFNIEEDAYQKLDSYLNEVKEHFKSYPQKDEIISDIEGRISEQFLQVSGPNKIVNESHVNELIKIIGKPADFDKESSGSGQEAYGPAVRANRRLFRNPDDVMIAGVASGLGAFFGTEPWLFRLIFVALIFAGGSGILFYIVLWIVMPEAKTTADKLAMRGETLTMESLWEKIRSYDGNRAEGVKLKTVNRKYVGAVVFAAFVTIFKGLVNTIKLLVKIVFKVAGAIIIGASFVALLAVTFIFVNLLFNPRSVYVDPVITQIFSNSHPLYYGALSVAFVIVAIVLIFLWIVGLGWFKLRTVVSTSSVLSLLFIFVAALIAGSVIFFKYGPEYVQQIKSLPQFQQHTVVEPLSNFSKIEVAGAPNVHIAHSKNYSVVVSGRQIDLDALNISVKDGTLSIGQNSKFRPCFICFGFGESLGHLDIEISAPNLQSVSEYGFADIKIDKIVADHLDLNISGSGTISADNVSANSLTAQIYGSGDIALSAGTASAIKVKVVGSGYYDSGALATKTADAAIYGSGTAVVAASDSLKANVTGSGQIIYYGNPKLTQEIHGSGSIEQHSSADKPASQ